MSLGPISRAASTFERNAPAACILGLRICAVALLIAGCGVVIAASVSIGVGYWVAVVGVVGGLVGLVIYSKGAIFDRKRRAP